MTTDPNDPTTPVPRQPAPQPAPPPSEPAPPAQQPAQPGTPAQQPAPPAQPYPGQPTEPRDAYDPRAPRREGTVEGAARVNLPRYLGGALAAVLVSALVAWVVHFVLTDLVGLTVMAPPDVLGVAGDSTTGERNAYALDTALLTVLAAIVLGLLALGAPRPRLFFGWLMVLLGILALAVPFTRSGDVADAVATAVLHLFIIAAVWSLLGGVAGRAIRPVEP